jgi:hypothetical protein
LFQWNSADIAGGAIDSNGFGTTGSNGASLTVTGTLFDSNWAAVPAGNGGRATGGAIQSTDLTSIQTSAFVDNSADANGGAIGYDVTNNVVPNSLAFAFTLYLA